MEHPIEIAGHVDMIADVVMYKFKIRIGPMMSDVGQIARHQIVHRHHPMPLGYQAIRHVAANETGAAGDQNSHYFSLLVKTERQRDRGTERQREGYLPAESLYPCITLSLYLSVSLSASSPSNSPILEPSHFDRFRVEHVAPVNEDLLIHHFADLIEVEVTEFFPLGDDDDRVAVFGQRRRALRVFDFEIRVLATAGVIRDRVVSLHAGAHLYQLRSDFERGGVAQVV